MSSAFSNFISSWLNSSSASTRTPPTVVDELLAAARQQLANVDETSKGRRRWLWVMVTAVATVYQIASGRNRAALRALVGTDYRRVLTIDRHSISSHRAEGQHQWCWSQLKWDFHALADSNDRVVKRLGHDLLRPTRGLFHQWSRCRDGTITCAELKGCLAPIRCTVRGLLLRGCFSGHPRLVGMCRELYEHRDWLWTFLDHEDVEPTNNASERSLRHAVISRKLSFGMQSPGGSRFVETMLTVIETCRQQSRNIFEYVTAAVQMHFAQQPTPSLLPRV
jgi:transposase